MSQALEVNNADAVAAHSRHDELVAKVDFTIERAQRALLAQQHAEGYWQAALEANAEMNAEYIIFNRFMELPPDLELDQKLATQILKTQQGDGSWALFPGGEGDLSTTIEAYFGLKLTGMRAGDEPMMQARRWILSKGGIANSKTLARFYLAAMNQVPWHATAALPIETTLLPKWFPLNMYELSSWARGTVFALMMLQAKKPTVGWRLGRDVSRRQGSRTQGQRHEHAVADRVGADRITCGRGSAERKRDARGGLARGTAERRRAVGRQRVYRHRFPEAPLPALPHVRALLSPDGAWSFPKENRAPG